MLPQSLSVHFSFGGTDSFAYKLATEYKVIMPSSSAPREERAANAVCRGLSPAISENGSVNITPSYDRAQPEGGKEILVGNTDRADSKQVKEGLAYYDYVIKIQGDKIVINGGSPTATLAASEKFIELLRLGGCFDADTEDYTYSYNFSTEHFSPLAYDISGFVPVWQDEYKVPDWMLDFDEKTFAITFNSSRNMSVSHRGDWQNYPENSLAAYASAILAGCDVIEIDVRETKDHIFVMLHDSALTRVTDYNEKGGKNGLPASSQLSDWTYEQLMQLNLKDKNGKVTEYKIPTLNEAIMIAARRCFVQLDYKVDGSCDIDTDVYPIAYQADAIPSFFYRSGYFAIEKWANRSGRESDKEYVKTCKQYLAMSGHSIRAKYWTTENSTTSTVGEKPEVWAKMRSEGKTLLWSNLIVTYCKYIAENFSPAK